ncbi:MAG: hypothetical protein K6E78_04030, partial [Treponema sp.]|nr:hypothetical protein [Treponema sp.]
MSDLSIRFDDYEDEVFDVRDADYSGKRNSEKKDKTLVAVKIIVTVLAFCALLEFFFYKFIIPSTTISSGLVSVKPVTETRGLVVLGMMN